MNSPKYNQKAVIPGLEVKILLILCYKINNFAKNLNGKTFRNNMVLRVMSKCDAWLKLENKKNTSSISYKTLIFIKNSKLI